MALPPLHRPGRRVGVLLLGLVATLGCATSEAIVSPEARDSLERGIFAMQQGDYPWGVELCEEALAGAGGDPEVEVEAHRWLAHAHAVLLDPERSLSHATAGVALSPEDAWLRYARGVALITMGELDEAEAALGRAITLDPGHVKAYQHRAEARRQLGRHEAAVEDCSRALEILDGADPEHLASWGGQWFVEIHALLHARATCRDALGEHGAAEADRARARALSESWR